MRLIALLVLALLVVVGAAAVDASHAKAGQQFQHSESFSPDAGNVTTLNNSNLDGVVYDAHVTVQDSDGTEMIAGNDYEWHEQNGTIKTTDGGRLDGESSATVEYGYSAPTETQNDLATLFANLFEVQTALLIVLAAAVVLGAMRILAGV